MNHNVCLSVCPKKNYRNVLTSEFLVNVVFVYFFLKTPPRPCFHLIFLQGVGRREVKKNEAYLWELFILRYFSFPEFRDKHNFCPLSLYLQIKCFILFRVPPKNQFCKCIVIIIIHNIIILFTTLFIAEIHFLFTLLILKAFKTICNKYLGYIFGLKGWKGKDGYDKCLYKETRRGGVWGLNYFFVQ